MNSICLLIEDKNHRKSLKELLGEKYTILNCRDSLPSENFDLCIIDRLTLEKLEPLLRARKVSESPVFLPFLLIGSNPDVDRFFRNIHDIIDDITELPVKSSVLLMRIKVLILARDKSLAFYHQDMIFTEEKTRLRMGMCAGKISFWELDLDSGEIVLTGEWKEQLGCHEEKLIIDQQTFFEHVHPEDQESLKKKLLKLIEDKTGTLTFVCRMHCHNKIYTWFILRSTFVRNSEGKINRLLVSQIDITDEKKWELDCLKREKMLVEANAVIQQDKRVLDAIMEYTPVGIILVDKDGVVKKVNRTFTEILGIHQSGILGKEEQPESWGVKEITSRKPPQNHRMPMWRAIREQKVVVDKEYLLVHDGKEQVLALSAAPVLDANGVVTGGVSVWKDNTVRKRIEEKLIQSQEKYRTLFNSIDEGFCIVQMIFDETNKPVDYRFLEVNSSFERQTGIQNAVGKRIQEISPMHEKYWFEIYGKIAKTGQPARFQNRAEQLHRWYDVYAFRFGKPENMQVAVLFDDVTDRKRADDLVAEMARFPEENPNPVLRLSSKGEIQYANSASNVLLKHCNTSVGPMASEPWRSEAIASLAQRSQRTIDFQCGEQIFSLNMVPVAEQEYINIYGRDITDRKHAEMALQESERRFHALADNITQLAWMSDPGGRRFWFNKRWYDYTGTTLEDVNGWGWKNQHHPDHIKRILKGFQHSWNTGELWEDISPLRSKEGEYRWFLSRAVPIRNDKGEVILWFGTNTDITDIRQSQEEAQRKRAETEAILKSLPDGYIMFDRGGQIVEMNDRAKNVMGITRSMQRHPYEEHLKELNLHTPDGQVFPIDRMPSSRALKGEIVRDVVIWFQKDGRDTWVSVSAAPVSIDGLKLGAVMEFVDITEIHYLQEQLADERNFMNAVLQTSGALIVVIDKNGGIVRFNRACEQLSGYTSEDVMGHSVFDFIPVDELEGVRNVTARLFAGEISNEYENHWLNRSGEKHFIRWRNSVLSDENGQVEFVIATGIDISDRKKLEEELNIRAHDLAVSNHELESFSYSISHDLRGPLSIIGGFASILLDDYADKLDFDAQDYLHRMDNSVKKMKVLIESLLSLSRISRQEVKREDVNLSALVNSYLRDLQSVNPQRRVNFIIHPDVHVNADPKLLMIALENLLRNAWKFTSKRDETCIEFGKTEYDGKQVFFIRDNGAGFDMKFAEKIFEPFKRIHSEKEFGGTGVGLSIVQRVIDRHGGKVWAEGETDKGATFYFTLR